VSSRKDSAGYSVGFQEQSLGKIYDRRLMARILHYLRPLSGLVALATGLLILFSLSSLAGPIVTRVGIDRYIAQGDVAGLARICLIWFGILVATGGLQYAQMTLTNHIGQHAMMQLRLDIYAKLHRVPISYFDRNPVGRLITRVTNDVEVLNQMFTQGVVAIFGDLLTLVGIMIVLVVLNLNLAMVTFLTIPPLFLLSLQFRWRVRRAFREIRVALARINAYLQEAIGGIAIIKAFRREQLNEDEFADLNGQHRDAFLRSVRAFSIYFPLVELIQAAAIALILWYGSGQLFRDQLTLGALVAFIQYVGRFFRPIRDLSDKFNILQEAMASSERIFDLLDEPTEPDTVRESGDFNPRGDIKFNHVSFSYDSQTPVLNDITINIPTGKSTAIVGATGAGKTTMAALLTRFYEPSMGTITVDGTDIRSVPLHVLRENIAIVQQDVFLFSGTVEENIRLWDRRIPDEHLRTAIQVSHADHPIRRLPSGLDSLISERGSNLSSGERQLVAFARALAFDPAILILDEATASVDSETEALIQDALNALLRGRTAVVIAHRLSTIRNADQILVIHHGKICQQGTHEELLASGGIYARLYQLQFQGQAGESSGHALGGEPVLSCD
jgi:ATP-binding cassette subfamily B protein